MSPEPAPSLPGAPKGPQSSRPICSSHRTGSDGKTEAQKEVRSSKIRVDKILGSQPAMAIPSRFFPLWAPVTEEWGWGEGSSSQA